MSDTVSLRMYTNKTEIPTALEGCPKSLAGPFKAPILVTFLLADKLPNYCVLNKNGSHRCI